MDIKYSQNTNQRGKTPTLQQNILQKLATELFSVSELGTILSSSQPNISKAMSRLQEKKFVTVYPSSKTSTKRGRLSMAEKGKSQGAPQKKFGLTDDGILNILNFHSKKLTTETFWKMAFTYFRKNNKNISLKIKDVILEFEKKNLKLDRDFAFTQKFRQEFQSIDEILDSIYYNDIGPYWDILLQLLHKRLNFNQIKIITNDKVKAISKLVELQLIEKDKKDVKLYRLTFIGIITMFKLFNEICDRFVFNFSTVQISDKPEKIKKLLETSPLLGLEVFMANKLVQQSVKTLEQSNVSKLRSATSFDLFYPYPKEYGLGGTTWEKSIFYNFVFEDLFNTYQEMFPLIFKKWKKLRQVWSTMELVDIFISQFSEEPNHLYGSLLADSGYQEIFDDYESLKRYNEDIMEHEYTKGNRVLSTLENNMTNEEIKTFEKLNYDVMKQMEILRIRLGYRVAKSIPEQKIKNEMLSIYEKLFSKMITFTFYLKLFHDAKDRVWEETRLEFFKQDKELVNWYLNWLSDLKKHRERVTQKEIELFQILS